jgi:NosR/NirI family transcriptional regulator, nitrous oxide reductase regulator
MRRAFRLNGRSRSPEPARRRGGTGLASAVRMIPNAGGRRAAIAVASWLRALLASIALAALTGAAPSRAGVLDAERLRTLFPAPYVVGEKDATIPVWPVFKQNGPATDLVCYVFESVDFAALPGFSGSPINLLIALDPNGQYLDVRVLSQHEPVFVDGLGEEPLFKFVAQYPGLSLKQTVKIGSGTTQSSRRGSTNAYVDGVAKATASVRILNQSLLAASLKVARSKLGFSAGKDPDQVARERDDVYERMDWNRLVESGLVRHLALRNVDLERAFAGTDVEAIDREAAARPGDAFIDLYAAMATLPSVGRNLLSEAAYRSMNARIDAGDHVLLLMSSGPYSFVPEDFVRASVPDRLSLKQDGLPIEMRDLDLDAELPALGQPRLDTWKAFRVISASGLDPGQPMDVALRVVRTKGTVYPERVARDFTLTFSIPERYLVAAPEDQKGWWAVWKARWPEIVVLVAALAALATVLARQHALVSDWRRLHIARPLFLLFTLGFIGWFAQAQLSIVNLVALLQAAVAHRSWTFFLYDPPTVILWAFVLVSLFVWGRGTFCGWLCPFGALQELAALIGRALRLPTVRLRAPLDRQLKRVKYAALAVILLAALWSPLAGDRAVEIEPFKTAITLVFARSWPYVLYAGSMVLAGIVVDKFFCRYLCPLGAGLALLGQVRQLDWITRRAECGRPCQTCRHRCTYQAIDAAGRIDYAECFQCMDCVAILRDDRRCAPRILLAKGRRMIAVAVDGSAGPRARPAPAAWGAR